MPNAKANMIIGSVASTAEAVADEKPRITQNVVVAPCDGGSVARLPDLFESTLHPNYRQFFHSLTTLAVVGVVYVSNLLADGLTPQGATYSWKALEEGVWA